LLAEVRPILDGVDQALESVNLFRAKPIGTLRLAVARAFAMRVLAPLIQPFLEEYPAIRLELAIDDTNSDIVRNRFDAGIRLGNMVERDMKIVRVMDDFKLVAVAAPKYLTRYSAPSHPRDLHSHNCIRYRLPEGTIIPWIFTMGRKRIEAAVEGSLVVNDLDVLLSVTLDGVGVGYIPEPIAEPYLLKGQLVRLLPTWDFLFPGIFLYHPSRRQTPMPLTVFLKFIKEWRNAPRSATLPK
jgi:DNA-binding transcriptional LysR family regulator